MTNEQTAILDAVERTVYENQVPAKQLLSVAHTLTENVICDTPEYAKGFCVRMRAQLGEAIAAFLEDDVRNFIPRLHFEEFVNNELYLMNRREWRWTAVMLLADWRDCKAGEACGAMPFVWNPITDTVVVIGPDKQRWNFRRASRNGVKFCIRTS